MLNIHFCVIGGAGHIGAKAVQELRKHCSSNDEIIIADKNLEKAENIANELDNVSAQSLDATEKKSLVNTLGDADVAISTLGPFHKFGKIVLEAAIEAETDFVDIDDDYDATMDCLELHEEAEKAGITSIIGLGATPGLTNIWAKYGADKLDEVEEINTSWTWTAIDPDMGAGITDHYFHAITGDIPTYRDGELIEVSALSEPEIVEFPSPLGEFEPANAGHPEPVTIPKYIEGVETVTNKGTVWPSALNEAAKVFAELGLTGKNEVNLKGTSIPIRDVMVEIVMSLEDIAPEDTINQALGEIEKYGDYGLRGVGLKTTVKGRKRGEKVKYEVSSACSDARAATAIPAVIGAIRMGEGEIEKSGVYAPEGVIDPEPFLKELEEDIEMFQGEEKKLKL